MIAEDLKALVKRETEKLKRKSELEDSDFSRIEKLTRSYTLLMADLRETVKSKVFADLDEKELEKVAEHLNQVDQPKRGPGRPRKTPRNDEQKFEKLDGDEQLGDLGLE